MDIMKNSNDEQNNEKIISIKEMFIKEEKDTCSDACVKPKCPKCGFALSKTQTTIRKYHHQS